jgi:hypothetical protein
MKFSEVELSACREKLFVGHLFAGGLSGAKKGC